MKVPKTDVVFRRLIPLYCASFLQSAIFWYAIEKLFMQQEIGFTEASIGVMAAVYSATMLITETPSGILADRWSRKGVLIIGSLALAVASLVCGLSNSMPVYIFGAAFWGVFYAMYSGTYDSIVYDVIQEETGTSEGFEKYYGYIHIFESAGLVVTALAGALIGDVFGMRWAFYASVPLALLSIVSLVLFREPKIHKAEVETPVSQHVIGTFKAVLRRGVLFQILCAVTGITLATEIIFEFAQLWYVAIALPLAIYGGVYALLLAAPGVAGWTVHAARSKFGQGLLLAVGLATAIGLVFGRAPWLVITLQAFFGVAITALGIAMNKQLHDRLPSTVRAGAVSAVGTISRVVFIPLSIYFGYLGSKYSVFTAGWVLVGVVLFGAIFTTRVVLLSSASADSKQN